MNEGKMVVLAAALSLISGSSMASDKELVGGQLLYCGFIAGNAEIKSEDMRSQFNELRDSLIKIGVSYFPKDRAKKALEEAYAKYKTATTDGGGGVGVDVLKKQLVNCATYVESLKEESQKWASKMYSNDWRANTKSQTLVVNGQGLSISFDAPELEKIKEAFNDKAYQYFGNSGRLNVSIYVEGPLCNGVSTNDGMLQCFESKGFPPPKDKIVEGSYKKIKDERFYKAIYDYSLNNDGGEFRQRHVNYFILYAGKWIHVHVSLVDPVGEDESLISGFENSLRIQGKS